MFSDACERCLFAISRIGNGLIQDITEYGAPMILTLGCLEFSLSAVAITPI